MIFKLTHSPRYEIGRSNCDYYPTPAWCVEALLLERSPLLHQCFPKNHSITEPSAGEGHISRILANHGAAVTSVELRESCRQALKDIPRGRVIVDDWFSAIVHEPQLLERPVIGNPPYSLAFEFAQSVVSAPYAALLLRLGFLESQERAAWNNAHPVTQLLVLGRRPSFTGDGRTDGTAYAWFIWERGAKPRAPKVVM